jgi:ferric-dicitrate binding protein FerR (iron transport regulator)
MQKYLFLFILTIFFSQSVFAQEIGKVLYIKGKAVSKEEGKKAVFLKKGSAVVNERYYKTAKNSLLIIALTDGSKIKLNPSSNIFLSRPVNKKKPMTSKLIKGSSFFNVLKSKLIKRDKFIVKTKFASLGVRGTEFFVSYGKGKKPQDMWMCVNEGLVAVKRKSGKRETLVKEGEGVQVSKRDGVTAPTPLPWTKSLNWNMNVRKGDVINKVNIEDAYSDPLDKDYD